MAEMKTLNGHEIVDAKARERLDTLEKEGVGGGGGDVSTGAMQAAIAAAIQEHNEQIEVHQNRLGPLANEMITLKQIVSTIPKFKIEVVTVHPTITEASTTTVYLVPSGDDDGNLYTEWICVEKDGARKWEKLGTQNLDLTGYVTDEELNAAVEAALAEAKASGEFKGDPYTLTETDKALIVAQVIESLGGNPIFGYVDEDNNIIVQGNLGDGTYSVKYEMEDGSTVDIGNLVLDTNVYYSITKNLTNCVIDNSATQVVEGGSYSATITENSGYELSSVSVTMGGSAVSVSGGVINIASVTGDIVITAVATETVVEIANLAVPNDIAGSEAQWNTGEWCNNSYMAGSSYAYRSSTDARVTTNTFEAEKDDIIYVKGIKYAEDSNCQIAVLDSAKNRVYHGAAINMPSNGYIDNLTRVSEDYWYFTFKSNVGHYLRLAGHLSGTNADVIITRNQPIV